MTNTPAVELLLPNVEAVPLWDRWSCEKLRTKIADMGERAAARAFGAQAIADGDICFRSNAVERALDASFSLVDQVSQGRASTGCAS